MNNLTMLILEAAATANTTGVTTAPASKPIWPWVLLGCLAVGIILTIVILNIVKNKKDDGYEDVDLEDDDLDEECKEAESAEAPEAAEEEEVTAKSSDTAQPEENKKVVMLSLNAKLSRLSVDATPEAPAEEVQSTSKDVSSLVKEEGLELPANSTFETEDGGMFEFLGKHSKFPNCVLALKEGDASKKVDVVELSQLKKVESEGYFAHVLNEEFFIELLNSKATLFKREGSFPRIAWACKSQGLKFVISKGELIKNADGNEVGEFFSTDFDDQGNLLLVVKSNGNYDKLSISQLDGFTVGANSFFVISGFLIQYNNDKKKMKLFDVKTGEMKYGYEF